MPGSNIPLSLCWRVMIKVSSSPAPYVLLSSRPKKSSGFVPSIFAQRAGLEPNKTMQL